LVEHDPALYQEGKAMKRWPLNMHFFMGALVVSAVSLWCAVNDYPEASAALSQLYYGLTAIGWMLLLRMAIRTRRKAEQIRRELDAIDAEIKAGSISHLEGLKRLSELDRHL
jgi:Flp pilus assembly protein TadB